MASLYDAWIGREETVSAVLHPWPAQALQATLGLDPARGVSDSLAPLWSWLYFLDTPDRATIGLDGHGARGGFMPPVEAPRRMFAGGRAEFVRPLNLETEAVQTRRVLNIEEKTGGAGPLVFVTVGVETRQHGEVCVRESRDIVYLTREPQRRPADPAPVTDAPWSLDLTPDPVMLMRFSALTFNAHRIHYDLEYARDVEGYPERVAHAPLTAILLCELARLQGEATLTSLKFRALAPLFCGQAVHLRGAPDTKGGATLTAYSSGHLVMTAEATLA